MESSEGLGTEPAQTCSGQCQSIVDSNTAQEELALKTFHMQNNCAPITNFPKQILESLPDKTKETRHENARK